MKGHLNKMLYCDHCLKMREHRFETFEWREMTFRGITDDGERVFFNGTGMKEIWTCNVCQHTRVYGAPSDMDKLKNRVLKTGVTEHIDPPIAVEMPQKRRLPRLDI